MEETAKRQWQPDHFTENALDITLCIYIYIYIYIETDLLHLLGILIYLRSFCMNRIKAAEWAFLGLLVPFQKLDIMFCTSDVLACA